MKINVAELQNSPDKQIDIVFHEKIDELENDVYVDAVLKAIATSFGVNIVGRITTDLKLLCDRCLEEYSYHVDSDVDENFVYDNIVPNDKKEYELKEGQFVEELKGSDEIDITEFLYQSIILEIPTQKICKESCEGSEEYKKALSEKFIDERLEVFKTFSENNFN